MKSAPKKTPTKKSATKKPLQKGGRKVGAATLKKESLGKSIKPSRVSKPIKRKRPVKNPDIAQLGSLQKQFVIAIPSRNPKSFIDRLEKFIPENPSYWESVEEAKCSREKYVSKLLDPGQLTKRVAAINRGARLVFSAASWSKPTAGPKKRPLPPNLWVRPWPNHREAACLS